MDCGSRRIIAPGRRGVGPGIRQKPASTPMPGAFSTIRRSMRPIGSSMAGMIPVPAPDMLALRPNGCSDIPRRRWQASLDSLALAERIAHPFTLSIALTFSSVLYLNRREPERALRQLEAAEALAAEQRLSLLFEPGMLRGVALLGQGAVDEAIARIREGVAKWTRLGRTIYLPYGLAFLAEGLARHGDRAAALAALREGLETAGATGEHMWDAELHRLTGDCAARRKQARRGPGLPCSKRSASRKPNKRSRWNCAPPRASPGCGASRAGGPKRATSSRRSTAGSPRASTPPI